MSGKNQWVVRRGQSWAVRGELNSKDTSHHDTQKEAIKVAREIAQNQHSELLIKGRDGKIREHNNYGYYPAHMAG